MKKYEYSTPKKAYEFKMLSTWNEEKFNELGSEGFHLVPNVNNSGYMFQKEIQNEKVECLDGLLIDAGKFCSAEGKEEVINKYWEDIKKKLASEVPFVKFKNLLEGFKIKFEDKDGNITYEDPEEKKETWHERSVKVLQKEIREGIENIAWGSSEIPKGEYKGFDIHKLNCIHPNPEQKQFCMMCSEPHGCEFCSDKE